MDGVESSGAVHVIRSATSQSDTNATDDMSLGIAAVIIFVLYLIDKHGRWLQTAKITAALVVLVLLGWAGLLGYDKYESWRRARAEHVAAVTACVAQNGSDPTTRKACETDPTVEVRVKVTANF